MPRPSRVSSYLVAPFGLPSWSPGRGPRLDIESRAWDVVSTPKGWGKMVPLEPGRSTDLYWVMNTWCTKVKKKMKYAPCFSTALMGEYAF